MRPSIKHLSTEEIEWLTARPDSPPEPSVSQELLDQASRHLGECPQCQRLVRVHKEVEKRLESLRSHHPDPTVSCPQEVDQRRLAAGIVSSQEADNLLEHAIQCDSCALVLRQAIEDFSEESSDEEKKILNALDSTRGDWQRQWAQQRAFSASAAARSGKMLHLAALRTPNWAWAGVAAATVLIVAAVWLFRAFWQPPVDQLLAQAYTEQRVFELRIPGASHAPLRQERGAGARSTLSRPAALLEAEAIIARKLAANPDQPEWLAARGRAELLNWNYAAAIHSFTGARELQPDRPQILIDLAIAHFQRAEAEGRAIDYGTAIEFLSQALVRNETDPVALFNRAIAQERLLLLNEAVRDWERYLAVEPQGEWAAEARERLEALRQRLRNHRESRLLPTAGPAAAVQVMRRRLQGGLPREPTDSLVEEYLNVALTRWLPSVTAGAAAAQPMNSDEWVALQTLSEAVAKQHGDRWLEELLASPGAPGFAEAAQVLGMAVMANAEGNAAEALRNAESAEHLFRASGNQAGAIRARLETVYALHLSLRAASCLKAALGLERELKGKRYLWIEAQLALEQFVCRTLLVDFSSAQAALEKAMHLTRRAGFGALHLRAVGFAESSDSSTGRISTSASGILTGLELYWTGSFPPVRAYQFYADLGILAEGSGQWHLATVCWREAVRMIAATPNRTMEARARYSLASVAMAAKMESEAFLELRQATEIYSSLPQDEVTQNYRRASEIALAAAENHLGDSVTAMARLARIRHEFKGNAAPGELLQFFQTLGEIEAGRHGMDEAERAFRAAVAIGEHGFRSLRGDSERLAWDRQTANAYRALVRLKLRKGASPDKTLPLWEWYRSASFRAAQTETREGTDGIQPLTLDALVDDPPAPRLMDIQSLLPSLRSETVLSFVQLADEIVIWAYDNRGIEHRRVHISATELETVVRRFSRMCADPSSNLAALRRDARQLYEWLVAPIVSHLSPARTLLVQPDGAIIYVPFSALVDEDGLFLNHRFAIVTSRGVSEPYRPTRPIHRQDHALVIGSPVLDESLAKSFPPLPDALDEARRIAARFDQATLLLQEQATLETLKRHLPQADVFHFSGHALSRVERSGLLLSTPKSTAGSGYPENLLDVGHLHGQEMRVRLVVLSACSSGMGERLGMVDPESLVRAFLAVGASQVVASRWNVDSAVTAGLMDDFYSALLAGQAAPVALREAARRVHGRFKTGHPYYWAGFNVFGHG